MIQSRTRESSLNRAIAILVRRSEFRRVRQLVSHCQQRRDMYETTEDDYI